jgi:hypothetical protein
MNPPCYKETSDTSKGIADDPQANELEIAILNLFVDIRIRYPNLVVGKLDRQNVKAAMEKGISAHQVGFVSPLRVPRGSLNLKSISTPHQA